MVYSSVMPSRLHKSILLFMAFLVAVPCFVQSPARAEAQMRCAGASPQSAPCARAELPAAGLNEKQVYGALMSCCRSRQIGCMSMRDCPMRHHDQDTAVTHHFTLSATHCRVSICVTAAVPTTLAVRRDRWLLTTSPAFAPPTVVQTNCPTAQAALTNSWTYSPALSPHAAPTLHGLRAPPAV